LIIMDLAEGGDSRTFKTGGDGERVETFFRREKATSKILRREGKRRGRKRKTSSGVEDRGERVSQRKQCGKGKKTRVLSSREGREEVLWGNVGGEVVFQNDCTKGKTGIGRGKKETIAGGAWSEGLVEREKQRKQGGENRRCGQNNISGLECMTMRGPRGGGGGGD